MKFGLLVSLLCCAVISLFSPVLATTICWDGHTLAADSQRTKGTEKMLGVNKIHRCENRKAWVACAGSVDAIESFIDWYDKAPSMPSKTAMSFVLWQCDIECIIVHDDGICEAHNTIDRSINEALGPIAVGSGEAFAQGAMAAGATAEQAIAIVEKLDIFTGGPIKSVLIKK
jgi:ATP-dependent protease HslVU (ClpYQ) peptidase subunit